MQLGFISAIVPDLNLEQVLALGHDIGYECVELMCWPPGKADRRYAGITHIDVTNFTSGDAARVNDLAAAAAISISGLGYYPNALSPVEEESRIAAEHLKRVITAARLLGLPVVSTFIGKDWKKSVDENWPRFKSIWRELISFADDNNIQIAIENCPMWFSSDEWPGGKNLAGSPAIWRRMFDEIPSANFGLNYDPSHLYWQQMDYIAPLTEFASRIFRVHAKDAIFDREKFNQVGVMANPLEYHAPRLPGSGGIDWGLFLKTLKASGYDGPTCVEVEDKRYETNLESRKEALRLSYEHLKNFFPVR